VSRTLAIKGETAERSVLAEAARVVAAGGVIVYPTETLYGIGAHALDPAAVRKVIGAKKRLQNKPILVIIDSRETLGQLAAEIPSSATALMDAFWPGPLTLVFHARPGLPSELTQGSETIGVRIPSSKFCRELLGHCGVPLTSTSANVSGEAVHRTIVEIQSALNEGIDLFIDAGTLPPSHPSTVVSVVSSFPKLIRQGVISFEEIQKVVPQVVR
jgi:L-threonylcarbamoyladenylate synthase